MLANSRMLALAALTFIIAGWAAPPPPPATFNISLFGFPSGPLAADGTWSSTGAIDDVGGFSATWTESGDKVIHLEMMLIGKQGSFTIHGTLIGSDSTFTGQSRLGGGAAGYTGIKGHGGASIVITSTDFTGTIAGTRVN
jgi:hypothetical protein